MKIGIPKEVMNNEVRVPVSPAGVEALVKVGHTLVMESGAGLGRGFADEEYLAAKAQLVSTAAEVWKNAEMVMKVRKPQPSEQGYFHEDLVVRYQARGIS
ncbi:hypothetical protein D2Q93_10555 [Alicyclobacillaceae bacterium I2511]|nr:hypothetical protein D2Q93_10555 [Alicyclobacillaceae bacterium I2511]